MWEKISGDVRPRRLVPDYECPAVFELSGLIFTQAADVLKKTGITS